MEVCLGVFLRPEAKFDSFQSLLAQIQADIEDSRFIIQQAEDSASVYSTLRGLLIRGIEHADVKSELYSGFIDLSQLSNSNRIS